jgi:hypothetical protein
MTTTRATYKLKDWRVITGSVVAVPGDRLIIQAASLTVITMPLYGEVTVKQLGTPATIGFNFGAINFQGGINTGRQYTVANVDTLVYVNPTIGWVSLNGLVA